MKRIVPFLEVYLLNSSLNRQLIMRSPLARLFCSCSCLASQNHCLNVLLYTVVCLFMLDFD